MVIKKPDGTRQEISLLKLKELNLFGNGLKVSTDLLATAVRQGVRINLFDSQGRVYGVITSPFLNQSVITSRAQLKSENSPKAKLFAQEVVLAKIFNQQRLIEYFLKHQKLASTEKTREITTLLAEIKLLRIKILALDLGDDYRSKLFALEGKSANNYWQILRKLLSEKWGFPGRVGRGASDTVNTLLNYGYSILYSRVLASILQCGLQPFAGFLHTDRSGKASLALDLMEIFRQPVVDRQLLAFLGKKKIVTQKASQEMIFDFAGFLTRRMEERFTQKLVLTSWDRVLYLQTQNVAGFLRGEKSLQIFQNENFSSL